jgi:RNA-directed DNA polymerase
MRPERPTIRRPFNPPISTNEELATVLAVKLQKLDRLIAAAPTLYTEFPVAKSNGELRIIRPPKLELRDLQRTILDVFQGRVRYPRWMTGGIPGRSIFNHARPHVGKFMVATFDVKSFFPNTTAEMVGRVIGEFGLRGEALASAVRLVTKDNELPQGGPTSLFLANLALEPADRRIDALSRKHGLCLTRYVDDLALSGPRELFPFQGEIVSAIERQGYPVALEKIRFMGRNMPQIVTKLQVNDVLRPTSEFVSEVNDCIWQCLNLGARAVADIEGISVARLKNGLTGKVSHVAQADPVLGKKLRGRLCGVDWTSYGAWGTPAGAGCNG